MKKEKHYTIDSDKLIKTLLNNNYIEYLGIGNRFDKNSGLHNDKFKCDNTFNWEITDDYQDNKNNDIINYYDLSNDFEIKEYDDILVLSKHIGKDIRAGYENDIIYIKNENVSFCEMIYENLNLGEENKSYE